MKARFLPLKSLSFPFVICLFMCLSTSFAEAKYVINNNLLRIGEGIKIEQNAKINGFVVCVGGPVKVYGEVKKSVISIGGSVMVYGKVEGKVTALGGGIRIDRKAEIKGDVLSVGGVVKIDPRAKVSGDVVERKYKTFRFRGPLYFLRETYVAISDFSKIIFLIGIVFLAIIIKQLFKERLNIVSTVYKKNLLVLILTGIITFMFFLFLSVFLLISVVFIPIIPILIFVLLILVLSGLIAFCTYFEDRFKNKFKYLSRTSLINLMIVVILWWGLVYFSCNIACLLFLLLSSYFLGAFTYYILFLEKAKSRRNK